MAFNDVRAYLEIEGQSVIPTSSSPFDSSSNIICIGAAAKAAARHQWLILLYDLTDRHCVKYAIEPTQ